MMMQKGQKSKFSDIGIGASFVAQCTINSGMNIDISCFGLNEQSKLVDERYMTFYNQPVSPNNEVKFSQSGNSYNFAVNHTQLPTNANRLVFTAAIDGNGTMKDIDKLEFKIGDAVFNLTGNDFAQEKAIMIAEVYCKDGVWRVGAVGQGFNGGLAALIVHFGGEVDNNTNNAASSNAAPQLSPQEQKQKVFLEKRINLEKNLATTAPKILDLSKKAQISLEKRGLGNHRAKVALCLDISYSMSDEYRSGIVQELVERVLALGCRLDDDGSIDVFLFGKSGHQPEPISVNDFKGYVNRIIHIHPLEGDTKYATAVELVRRHYTHYQYERSEPLTLETPVYVMFVTDGQPSDKAQATRALRNASYEPIFWQFMGVGDADLSYLERLDDLDGRYVDNADFFRVINLRKISDEQLYEKMVNEYPLWLQQAQTKRLISL